MKYFAALFSILWVISAQSEDVFDLAAKYNRKKHQVTDLEERKRQVMAEIYTIEKETNKIVNQKAEMAEKQLKLNSELKTISKEVVSTEDKIARLTPLLKERIDLLGKVNNLPWFYAMLTSQSLIDLDRTYAAAQRINELQTEEMSQFLKLIQDLEKQKQELKSKAREIVIVRKQVAEKEKQIASNQVSKKRALKRIKKHLKNEKKRLISLQGRGRKALKKSNFKDLSLLFGSDFFDQKGQLPEPINAALTHGYGLNQGLSEDQVQLIHKGHFYSSPSQQDVYSVARGRVRAVRKLRGYGRVVIVDHGSRYYTIYGNLKKTLVKKGEEVGKKVIIGQTGHDHLQQGMGLYFEIRHFSQPQNPKDWLKKSRTNLATL